MPCEHPQPGRDYGPAEEWPVGTLGLHCNMVERCPSALATQQPTSACFALSRVGAQYHFVQADAIKWRHQHRVIQYLHSRQQHGSCCQQASSQRGASACPCPRLILVRTNRPSHTRTWRCTAPQLHCRIPWMCAHHHILVDPVSICRNICIDTCSGVRKGAGGWNPGVLHYRCVKH